MRLALDVSHLNHQKLSGIGIYTVELMRALKNINGLEVMPVHRASRFRHRKYFQMHAGATKPWLFGGIGLGADILHGPDFRVGKALSAKRVASIMDLAFLKEGMTSPEFATKKKKDLDQLLDHNTPDALIAISEATRRDLIAYRPELASRVHTVLLGGDHFQSLAKKDSPHPRPYFLFVGNLEARKNVLGILAAFESFATNTPGYDLVLIGKPGYGAEPILKGVENSPVSKRIRVVGYTQMPELESYFRHAVALVYPSWIEGFGIPVIEAMHLGCPVITSNTTSTAEIIGDTGWSVDPARTESITDAMFAVAKLKNQPDQLAQLVRKAKERAAQFTWKKCAQETFQVYLNCLK
jgi:glycosyltransferase involved in cell wall biosynthesis